MAVKYITKISLSFKFNRLKPVPLALMKLLLTIGMGIRNTRGIHAINESLVGFCSQTRVLSIACHCVVLYLIIIVNFSE